MEVLPSAPHKADQEHHHQAGLPRDKRAAFGNHDPGGDLPGKLLHHL